MLTKYFNERDNSLFDPFYLFSDCDWQRGTARLSSRKINYSVTSDEKSLTLTVDLPGVRKEDLHVEATGQHLSIKAKRGEEDYSTSYKIGKDYDTSQPDACLENGVLTLRFEKTKSSDTKTIQVR